MFKINQDRNYYVEIFQETLDQLSQMETSSSRGGRSRGGRDDDVSSNTEQYLQDLERALSEFKNLSEAYAETAVSGQRKAQLGQVAEAAKKGKRIEKESESEEENENEKSTASEEEDDENQESSKNSPNSEDNTHPLEAMESEDLGNLTIPESEGEIIDLNANPSCAIASSVRKRH